MPTHRSAPAVTAMTKTVSFLVPDRLLPSVTAFLESAPDVRAAMEGGRFVLSTDLDGDADLALAPSLEGALQWGYDRDERWPYAVAHASVFLGQVALIAARGGAVIREQDLEARPNFVLQTIAEKIGLSRKGESEAVPLRRLPPVIPADLPAEISPLRMYSETPAQKGVWTYWPQSVFCTYYGPCPASIDLTGCARLLFLGPFIVLPPGTWRADLEFDLTAEALPYDYFVEFGGADRFERMLFRPKAAGPQVISMQYTVQDRRNIEIKFGTLRAVFHGELKLEGARLTKIG